MINAYTFFYKYQSKRRGATIDLQIGEHFFVDVRILLLREQFLLVFQCYQSNYLVQNFKL